MRKDQLAKIEPGDLVSIKDRASKYAHEYVALVVARKKVTNKAWSYSHRSTTLDGLSYRPAVGQPRRLGEIAECQGRLVSEVLARKGTFTSAVAFAKDLDTLQEAARQRAASAEATAASRHRAKVQDRIDTLRGFGLTTRFAGYDERVKDDGWEATVTLDRYGSKVEIDYEDLVKVLNGSIVKTA